MSTVLPFAATMLLAFGFALGLDRLLLAQVAPALLWLAALFAAVELCHRSYQHEAANDALEGLLLSPVDKGSVYLGKAANVDPCGHALRRERGGRYGRQVKRRDAGKQAAPGGGSGPGRLGRRGARGRG